MLTTFSSEYIKQAATYNEKERLIYYTLKDDPSLKDVWHKLEPFSVTGVMGAEKKIRKQRLTWAQQLSKGNNVEILEEWVDCTKGTHTHTRLA